ncbi:NAD(P)-dependent oxidoreductase [Ornithinicoccus halotolerans]|uniref:NAD(P)-dependent oxidoreductase n=1 Tax=Ornithinicoccus halotolerans TaxID=1748220 RepID=UPI003898DD18
MPNPRVPRVTSARRDCGAVSPADPANPWAHRARELAIKGRGAFLVNVARGPILQPSALVHALRNEALPGAALDVTNPTRLPPRHPVWALPNCLITPRIAGIPDMIFPLVVARVVENARRLQRGAAVVGEIALKRGYQHRPAVTRAC